MLFVVFGAERVKDRFQGYLKLYCCRSLCISLVSQLSLLGAVFQYIGGGGGVVIPGIYLSDILLVGGGVIHGIYLSDILLVGGGYTWDIFVR